MGTSGCDSDYADCALQDGTETNLLQANYSVCANESVHVVDRTTLQLYSAMMGLSIDYYVWFVAAIPVVAEYGSDAGAETGCPVNECYYCFGDGSENDFP